ncbi:MAG: chemotaxis protein CheD [Deferribacterales bacterium]
MIDDASCKYLLPGDLFYFDTPTMINTVLGSCVSVTMFARHQMLGLICHSMLPGPDVHPGGIVNFKYTDSAIMHMNELLKERGIHHDEVEVKVFGGSDMFAVSNASFSVGQKNISAAVETLEKLHFKISARDTGGQFTRKLYFSTETGIVYVRKISKLQVL